MSRRRRGTRSIRMWLTHPPELDDDLPLSMLFKQTSKRAKKKSTPKTPRQSVQMPAPTPPTEVISLDDSPYSVEIVESVNSKIGNFMETGSFISSDEDDVKIIKTKNNKKFSPNQFFISDDSDDEILLVKPTSNGSIIDTKTPGTSGETSSNSSKDKEKSSEDDVMAFVDNVLSNCTNENEKCDIGDMKSFEDLSKETQEMLSNASTLLDEIKTRWRLPESSKESKTEGSSSEVTIGSCPICLESLAQRNISVTVCGHIFCKECIMQTAKTLKKCPTCRKAVSAKKIHPIYF